jgi:transposase
MRSWDRLTAFAHEPLVWLDNNPTERSLRGPVVAGGTTSDSKSARGTEAAAILYSLVESAKVCGVDPCLNEVAKRARREPKAVLLPSDHAAQINVASAAA